MNKTGEDITGIRISSLRVQSKFKFGGKMSVSDSGASNYREPESVDVTGNARTHAV